MNSNKKGKFDLSEGDNFNLLSSDKLLKIQSEIANIHMEIARNTDKIDCLHKSIAHIWSDMRVTFREELTRAKGGL